MAIRFKRFFEEPVIFIIVAIFGAWLYLDAHYRDAGIILFMFSSIAAVIFLFIKLGKYKSFEINSQKGNTPKSILYAIFAVIATIVLSMISGVLVLQWDTGSVWNSYQESSRGAVLGSSANSAYAGNAAIETTVFTGGFPISETVLAITLGILMALMFGVNLLDKQAWKNPLVYVVAALVGIGAIVYHLYAKVVSSGQPNYNALLVIFWIFFVEFVLAVVLQEYEAAIWHHVINNILALGIPFVFGAMLSVWYILALVIIMFALIYYSKNGRNVMRKMRFAT